MNNNASTIESIPTSKATFWQGFVGFIISLVTTFALLAFYHGVNSNRLLMLESQAQKTEQNIDKINQKLDSIKDNAIKKEDFDELRRDVKELGKRK